MYATCYIKYSTNHYIYIQPRAHRNEISFKFPERDETIIPTVNVYSSPEGLDGIVKNNIPLYSLVMFKHHNLVELLSSNKDNKRKDEFQMKTKKYHNLPHLQST